MNAEQWQEAVQAVWDAIVQIVRETLTAIAAWWDAFPRQAFTQRPMRKKIQRYALARRQ
jgi:hypothetical protein